MAGAARIPTVCLALSALVIPAAFGYLFYGYVRAWTFMPGLSGMPSAIVVFAIVPSVFVGLFVICITELIRGGRWSHRSARIRRGRCWRCNYPYASGPDATASDVVCSECGLKPDNADQGLGPSLHAVAIAWALSAAAIVPGAMFAEWQLTGEDQDFVAYVRSTGGQHNAYRDRAWPFQGFSFVYLPGYGFDIND